MSDYWTDNNIKKPAQFVVCAACKFDRIIITGARHWDSVMLNQLRMMKNSDEWKQYNPPPAAFKFKEGFIDQFGDFLTREEAMKIAITGGQKVDIERGCGGDAETLYSEGLY